MTEDEMVGWLAGNGQRGLVCCSPWGHKESDTTDRLNCTELSSIKETNLVADNSHSPQP